MRSSWRLGQRGPARLAGAAGPVLLALMSLAGPLAVAAGRDPRGPVALVFPPWWSSARAAAAAAEIGPLLALGRTDFIVVVRAEAGRRPASSGAWLVLPARAVGCAVRTTVT